MDIESLISKRQKNVQEQNAVTKYYMHEHTAGYRESPNEYLWLTNVLEEKKLNKNDGILVSVNSCIEQGPVEELSAIWVTNNNRFYEINIILKYGTQEILEVESVEDITDSMNVKHVEKGRGKTFGMLALEILRELK